LTQAPDAGEFAVRYPDFLCIGAQKAGTTWLDRNLRRHPDLWLPPMKELQYFNHIHIPSNRRWTSRQRHERGMRLLSHYIEKTAQEEWDFGRIARVADIAGGPVSDDWYGRVFGAAGPEKICGEVTPDYATLPEAGIRHVLRLSPDVRIMLSLRDPIERSWSHIRMTTQTRGVDDVAAMNDMASNIDQVRRGDYPSMIANWRRFIPENRFLVLFMDDIVEKPQGVIEDVCRFLGVRFRERRFAKADTAVHVGKPQEMPASVRAILKERLRPIYDNMAALYPEVAARWMERHY
jgi:hypothetical protein